MNISLITLFKHCLGLYHIIYFCSEITKPTPVCSVVVHLPPTALSEVCLWELLSLTLNIKSCDFLPPPAIKETTFCCCGPHLCLFSFSLPLPPPVSHKQTDWSKRESQKCSHKYSSKSSKHWKPVLHLKIFVFLVPSNSWLNKNQPIKMDLKLKLMLIYTLCQPLYQCKQQIFR